MADCFYQIEPEGVRLFIRLTPKASKNAVAGFQGDGSGQLRLKISVTAVPEKGKANKALIGFLAKRWHLPKSRFTLVSGQTDRNKIIVLSGEVKTITAMLDKEKGALT